MDKTELISHSQKAVEELAKISQKKSQDKKLLLTETDAVRLQFAVKKIDSQRRSIKLTLPKGLDREKEVCLFVKDLDKTDRDYEQTVRHYKHSLKEQGIDCISQIIPLKALKLEYKPYEAKRQLSNSFDTFLADARIIRLLPPFLGNAFYKKKRQPIQVRMESTNLKEEIQSAISCSHCHWTGKGPVGMATVGYMDMSPTELVQNIVAGAEQIAAAIPGGPDNIRAMYIKTEDSEAIPVYLSVGSANDVQLPEAQQDRPDVVMDEVTTVVGGLVKVYPTGVVKVVNKTEKPGYKSSVGNKGNKTARGKRRAGKTKGKLVKRVGQRKKKVT